MSTPKRHVRLLLRLTAIGLVAAGAVFASGWFETLLHGAVVTPPAGGTDSPAASLEALKALTWGIPMLLIGVILLILTSKRQQVLSLTGRSDDC